ncbi:MAG: SGNH hydrolase domain-containing protein, partial [Pseudomonadota bacterium]
LERNRRSIAALDSVGDHPRLIRIRPADWLCDSDVPGRCIAARDGVPLYFDDDHLNSEGSRPVIDRILEIVRR